MTVIFILSHYEVKATLIPGPIVEQIVIPLI